MSLSYKNEFKLKDEEERKKVQVIKAFSGSYNSELHAVEEASIGGEVSPVNRDKAANSNRMGQSKGAGSGFTKIQA